MNQLIIKGRLTKDPEIKYAGEMAIANYNIAVDRSFKKEGEATADFFTITAFKKQAEIIEKHLKKGSEILITCRVQNHNWTDKEGKKHYDFQFLQETMDFCGSKVDKNATEDTKNEFTALNTTEDELPFV